jgi:hypothetical protein
MERKLCVKSLYDNKLICDFEFNGLTSPPNPLSVYGEGAEGEVTINLHFHHERQDHRTAAGLVIIELIQGISDF